MTVRIVTLFRGWQWIAWSCGTCAAAKKRQGWSVSLGKVVEQGCDFCDSKSFVVAAEPHRVLGQ